MMLYYCRMTPAETPWASVCLVHGFAEHSGRYLHVAEALVLAGLEVHFLDLRGFGYSGGARASCPVDQLHKDVHSLLRQASDSIPVFLLGFSMGGMLVASFLMMNPGLRVHGVILVNPLVEVPSVP